MRFAILLACLPAVVQMGCAGPQDRGSEGDQHVNAAGDSKQAEPEPVTPPDPEFPATEPSSDPCDSLDPPPVNGVLCETSPEGHVLGYAYDIIADGGFSTLSFTYDEAGNNVIERDDENGDGEADYVTTRTYDGDGHALTEHVVLADGSTYWQTSWSYDASGNMLEEAIDYGGDGVINLRNTQVWTAGRLQRVERFHQRLEQLTTSELTWNEAQQLVAVERMTDGTALMRSEYVYDDDGDLLSRTDTWFDVGRVYACTFAANCSGPFELWEGNLQTECTADCALPVPISAD